MLCWHWYAFYIDSDERTNNQEIMESAEYMVWLFAKVNAPLVCEHLKSTPCKLKRVISLQGVSLWDSQTVNLTIMPQTNHLFQVGSSIILTFMMGKVSGIEMSPDCYYFVDCSSYYYGSDAANCVNECWFNGAVVLASALKQTRINAHISNCVP